MLQWKIGNVTVTRIVELEAPGMSFILPDAVPENLKQIPWLSPHFVDENWEGIGSIHALIVESQGQRIMVDTCVGNDKQLALKFWCNRSGPFLADMESAGFTRDNINTVLCTHLHPDHVGWNTMMVDGKWEPTFPKAEYLFGRVEWEHWSKSENENDATLLAQSVQPVIDAELHTLVEDDHRITDEVWLEPSPGHTPGHVSVRIASEGEAAIITGDLMHHPCQMAHPEWGCSFDTNSKQAKETRNSFLSRYSDTPVLVIGTHFATPTAGMVVRDGDAYRLDT